LTHASRAINLPIIKDGCNAGKLHSLQQLFFGCAWANPAGRKLIAGRVTMNPLQIVNDFGKTNPQAAALLLGAIACFAAVAAVGTLGINLQSEIPSVLYVIGIGVLLSVVTTIVGDKLIMVALKWFVVGIAALWVALFIVQLIYPESQRIACAVHFWAPCQFTADKVAEITADKVAESTGSTPAVPAALPEIPPNPGFRPDNYKVFVQFAGVITRDSVKTGMRKLGDKGWKVQGANLGGERTVAAAGYNEVRYPTENDRQAAQALANQVANLTSHDIKVGPTPTTSVAKGSLEVWISR
jgi:uncharacterized membrane protein YuzA (DUF378 family)